MFPVALVDHKGVNVCLYTIMKKMIPLFGYIVPVLAVLRKINRRVIHCEWVQLKFLLVARYLFKINKPDTSVI